MSETTKAVALILKEAAPHVIGFIADYRVRKNMETAIDKQKKFIQNYPFAETGGWVEADKETLTRSGVPERVTCSLCAIKHIGQSKVLLDEARKGYPDHYFIALAHMAEAEDEIIGEYPEQANKIRGERKRLESDEKYTPKFLQLIREIDEKCPSCELQSEGGKNPISEGK